MASSFSNVGICMEHLCRCVNGLPVATWTTILGRLPTFIARSSRRCSVYLNFRQRMSTMPEAVEDKPRYSGMLSTSFTNELTFVGAERSEPVPVYRVMDREGKIIDSCQDPKLSRDVVAKMYKDMKLLNVMDKILYESQRHGRISFYLSNHGEEGTHVGSAAALDPDDLVFAQYREVGVLIWRGFTVDGFIDQCFGTKDDLSKGRSMPITYGSRQHNFVTISSPIATQMPQAAGAAYAFKMAKKDLCVVCYFGDGASSEGDAHAAFNFAAVLDCPVVFFCRNNGYAISTPTTSQYRGDGIAARGRSYGISALRVDGNDVFAVYNAVKTARQRAISEKRPILIEAMTYRVGHHTTSDDSSTYRSQDEVEYWMQNDNPLTRLRRFMERRKWWTEEEEQDWNSDCRRQVLGALERGENKKMASPKEMFKDVYSEMPRNLEMQLSSMKKHLQLHHDKYPLGKFDQF